MKHILVKNDIFTEQQFKKLEITAEGCELTLVGDEISEELLSRANAIIGNLPPEKLADCRALEWLQLNSSGADAYANSGFIPPEVSITTATGAYGIGIAEYMIAMLLNMMKRIPSYYNNQKAGIWRDEGIVTTPHGKRVLIVGTGNLGTEFARRLRPFGAEIIGIRRRAGMCPEEYDAVFGMDSLAEQLKLADVVALCLPGTNETYHLMDQAMLAECKHGAYLMNVGRGNVIPLSAMLDPEVTGRFAGIWLDVCELEPLPDGHPLFAVPNLLLTPHITGGFHLDLTVRNIYEITEHNLKAWLNNGEFRSLLDRGTGYCR